MADKVDFSSAEELAAYIVREFGNYEIVDFKSIDITFGPHPLEASVSFDNKSVKMHGLFAAKLKDLNRNQIKGNNEHRSH